MIIQPIPDTVEDFDQFIQRPENLDKCFEYIGGKIVKTPFSLELTYNVGRVGAFIFEYLQQHDIGYVIFSKHGEGRGYMVSGERYIPDVAYLSKVKKPQPSDKRFSPVLPGLVVEFDLPVISNFPSHVTFKTDPPIEVEANSRSSYEFERNLRIKLFNYLAAGTIVWIPVIDTKTVEVYLPGQPVKVVGIDGTIDGGDVLPGFTLPVTHIFPDLEKE